MNIWNLKRKISISSSPIPIPVDGMWFIGALPQHIKHGYDEKSTIAYIKKTIKPGDVFVDIGSNYGYFTILAAKLGATVEAYEPDPTSFWRTKWNVRINGLSSRVRLHNVAVSNTEGVASFFIDKPGSGLNSLISGVLPSATHMQVRTERCVLAYALCKVDVEGAELLVLQGLKYRGKVIVEFCTSRLESMGLGSRKFLNEVRNRGWQIYDMHEQEITNDEAVALAEQTKRKTINILLMPSLLMYENRT